MRSPPSRRARRRRRHPPPRRGRRRADAAAGNAPPQHAAAHRSSGENAEAYFSFDGKRLTFQTTARTRLRSDLHDEDRRHRHRSSSAPARAGRPAASTTPDGKIILYASTHLGGDACPPVPGRENGYVWPVYDTYDIFSVNADGSDLTRLTNTPGYDAEATIAKDGRIVFTSVRDGDMDIYSMNGDGSDVRRLTNLPGPDGGPFFSADGSKIVFRGRHPDTGQELDDYFALLKKALWKPAGLDVFVDESRRQRSAAGDEGPRRRELGAVLHARRQEDHLRVEHEGPARRQLRSLSHQPRRHRPRAGHVQRRRSTASRCSRPTARSSSSRRTGTTRPAPRRMSSSRTG